MREGKICPRILHTQVNIVTGEKKWGRNLSEWPTRGRLFWFYMEGELEAGCARLVWSWGGHVARGIKYDMIGASTVRLNSHTQDSALGKMWL
jgi:hypothetical protein